MKEHNLYLITIKWYNEDIDDYKKDIFYGYGETYADVCARIESIYSYISKLEIKTIETYCGIDDLLCVTGIDKEGIKIINEANQF